jgi:subtilisin family serine protease
VAILDTGVDVTHDELHGLHRSKQLVYHNFVGAESSIPRDDCGHGTHVTSILHKVAKNVDLYVARVSADGESWKSSQVTKVGKLISMLSSRVRFYSIATASSIMSRRHPG